jgi:NADH-quinone oxidoreductase subunit L
MMIGTLAITGVGIPLLYVGFPIGFAGFVSKDAIIEVAYVGSTGAFWTLVVAATLTSFYSWRLMFMTFYGTPRGDRHTHDHAHESPAVMTIPLAVLAVGSIFAGMVFYGPYFGSQAKVDAFFGIGATTSQAHAEIGLTEGGHDGAAEATAIATDEAVVVVDDGHGEAPDRALQVPGEGAIFIGPENHVIHEAHEVPIWVKLSPFVAMLLGLGTAWMFYIRAPGLPGQWATNLAPLHQFLWKKWYFDEIYDAVLVRPAKTIGRFFWKRGDGTTIDGGINGLAMGLVPAATRWLGRAQSGYVFTYAFAMVMGLVVLITWMTLAAGN